MTGIYKITSPSKKIYIGQSVDIERRFRTYKSLGCKTQIILYNSLLKYGIDKHKFEILCECNIEELNDKERYYQELYDVINNTGLNCRLTTSSDSSGKLSKETRNKMSIARKGIKHSEETILKIIKANTGKKRSEESKLKMKGRIHSEEARLKMSLSNIGKKHSEDTKRKMTEAKLKMSDETKIKMRKAKKKLIINIQTGIFYFGCEEAAKSINIKKESLRDRLNGKIKNKTSLIYV